jgi:hypothetical protein
MEVHGGVLDKLADMPVPRAMSAYGERWHLRTLSFKRFPGCAYISAAVDAAFELAPLDLESVEEVEVGASIFTIGMEGESAPFVRGPHSPLPALNFSVGYSLATALETGALEVVDLHGDRLGSEQRWRLAQRVRLRHDRELTIRALGATAPVGAAIAWAGEDARQYLAKRGTDDQLVADVMAAAAANNDDPTFLHPSKRVGARLRVKLRDGTELRAERDAAVGSCQEPVAHRLALAERKYLDAATARIGADAATTSREVIRSLYTDGTADVSSLWAQQRFLSA